MSDEMSNLMKIFVKDEDENAAAEPASEAAPNPANPEPPAASAPTNGSHPSQGAPVASPPEPVPAAEPIFKESPAPLSADPLSQAELAAAQLQKMILGEGNPEPAPTPAPEPVQPSPSRTPEAQVEAPKPAPEPVPAPISAASLSNEDFRGIHEALSALSNGLENLPQNSPNDEPLLKQIGSGGLNFVEQAMQVADRESGILPRSFDLETFRKEGQLLRDLGTVSEILRALVARVESAEAAIGSDAFTRALAVYQAARLANTTADLDRFLA